MAKNVNHVSLIKSTNTAITSGDSVFIASGQTGPKLPTPDVLIQGEIAVNLAKGVETLSIKNTDNEIVTFSSDKIIKKVIVDNERITAAALNDLEVNKQDVLTAGQGIDITNNVISATLDVTVDDVLDSGSTNPVANSAITSEFDEIKNIIDENELIIAAALNDLDERKLDASAYTPTDLSDLYALSAVVSANSVVVAAALNDLNTRLLPTITGVSFNEQLAYVDGGVAYLDGISAHTHAISEVDGLQASLNSKVSGITVNNANKVTPTNGVANLTINANTVGALPTGTTLDGIPDGTNRKLTDYATTIEYYSSGSTHEIRLKNGNTTLATVNANDFIKDGMVDDVTVDEPTSGQNSGVTCLIVTFNTDAGKEDIEIPLSEMFDSSLFYTKEEIDDKLGSGFTGENSGVSVTEVIEENELIVASALNDLEERKLDASAYTPTDLSGYYTKQEIDEDKLGSGFTGVNSGVTVTQAINETETVVAAALNDLNDRIDSLDGDIDALESAIQNIDLPTIDGDSDLWSSGSTGVPATSALSEVLEEIEEVTATALNDLNDKIAEVSGNQLTADSFKTINNESIIGTGNIEIQGGGSDANALSGVSVNGTAASVSNKVANITSVPADIVATSSTLNFVSNTEKNSWNTVTAKTDTTAFTQHTGDTTAHVTSGEKSTWNGKQDALSCGELKGTMNRSDVSGSGSISIKNTSGEFPTVVTAGTYKVVTYMSSTTQSYGLNVTFGGNAYSLTTSNGVIEDEREITITSNKTWSASVSGTVAANTVLIVKLYLVSSNVSVLGLVAVSNDYDDLYNKPTIPTSLSDINSAHTHSEYALNTAFTAHTASTTAHVTSAEKTQWNNAISGVSFNGTDATVVNRKAIISAETGTEIVRLRAEETPFIVYKYYGTETVVTADQVVEFIEDDTKEVVIVYDVNSYVNDVNLYLDSKTTSGSNIVYGFSNVIRWERTTIPSRNYVQFMELRIAKDTGTTPANITSTLNYAYLTTETLFNDHTNDTTVHVTPSDKSTWNGKQDALSNASVLTGITSAKVTQWDNAISGVSLNGTAATVTNHVAALTGVATTTDLNTHTGDTTVHVTAANKTQWNNAISGVSLNGTAATVTNHVAALTGVATTANVSTHSGTTIPSATSSQMHLPAVTAADNGKILMVVNGQWALVNPTTIYTGSGTPSGSQGNDGDIYLQTS